MKRSMLIALVVCGCSSSSTSSATGIDAAASADSPTAPGIDAAPAVDAKPGGGVDAAVLADAGLHPLPDALSAPDAAQMATLTIDNYLSWCQVKVGGVTYDKVSVPPLQFVKGTVVQLHGDPETKDPGVFVWGYWTGTDPGGMDANKDTTVTMTMNKSVLACCPFASDPTPSCPTN